ncbi:MAG: succinate dehydrogenase cytochrome b subunit [Bryobacterales bacterium]|nr:succinate dehydrogenase cytochrome b subunit [Bryobacterales bacterium]
MSTMAVGGGLTRSASFYDSVIGKKAVMAITGFILFGFVLVHMAGNLQVFLPVHANGVHPLDEYGAKLRAMPPLLWGARIVLLVAVILHFVAAIQLSLLNKRQARPQRYVKLAPIVSTYASRTMIWGGLVIFFYVIYHLLHLTIGARFVNPTFEEGHVYQNLVSGLQNPVVAIFYMIANIVLAIHLYHGIWSMFQSLGIAHPRYTPILKRVSAVLAWVIGIGFCSVPLAVLTGFVKMTGGNL